MSLRLELGVADSHVRSGFRTQVIPADMAVRCADSTSWQRLHDEALEKFFYTTCAGEYEAKLAKEFDACLPESPSS